MQHTGEVLAACHSPASALCRCQSHLRPNCLRWKVANCVKELLRLFNFLKLRLGDAWFAFDCAGSTSPLARDFTHYRDAFPFAKMRIASGFKNLTCGCDGAVNALGGEASKRRGAENGIFHW